MSPATDHRGRFDEVPRRWNVSRSCIPWAGRVLERIPGDDGTVFRHAVDTHGGNGITGSEVHTRAVDHVRGEEHVVYDDDGPAGTLGVNVRGGASTECQI